MKNYSNVLAVAAAVLLAACASADQALHEPQLTNPPRRIEWQGWDASEEDADATVAQRKYDGALRLPLSEDWEWELPDDGVWAISRLELASPAVAEDKLLVGSSRRPGLFVLDRTTGRAMAAVDTEGPVQAAPVALPDGGWVVVDSFGTMQRLNAALEPVWNEPYRVGGAVYRSPTLSGDEVLVSTVSDSVVAVGLDDGAWRWAYTRDVPRGSQELAILGAPAPVVIGDEVVIGFSDGAIVGLQPGTGRELWAAQVGTGKFPDIQAEVIDNGDIMIAAAFGGPVVGLDATSHQVRWVSEESSATSTMVMAGGYLYTADTQGRVRCLDPDTGEAIWTFDKENAQFGPPVRAGGSILVGDVTGTLYAIDRFEGTEQWKFIPRAGTRLAGVAAPPVVVGRQVLFPSAGGTLWSLVGGAGSSPDDSEEPAVRGDRILGW